MELDLGEFPTTGWMIKRSDAMIELVLSHDEIMAGEFGESVIAGMAIDTNELGAEADIPAEIVKRARVLIVEVKPESAASLRRLTRLHTENRALSIIAAVRDPSIAAMQALLRAGISDVVALPLARRDVEAALDRIRGELEQTAAATAAKGKTVSIIKSVGGVGATALLTQAAALYARRESDRGRTTCLFDLDLQGGNAATHLGLGSDLTVSDLLDAGKRLDPAVLASVATEHSSGLNLFAAPTELMPTDAVGTDQICDIVHLASTQYGTVFLDLPSDWTNWSLSLVAQSDIVFLVIELSIASLRQAQRQLALLVKLGVNPDAVQVVVNRVEKQMFKQINLRDASETIGRPIGLRVISDFALMNTALNRGTMIGEIKNKSAIGRDLEKILDAIDMLFERG
ncbi:pilus assembly protein CpaE [Sphingomonas panacisoli]|uniref:Pilus assembly protein CpaE n=1 Tax=Sphingomonas panacisoli TaxID=1813879 RepID=A0A5B8LK70_9SPHN|nr:pilus assembly protein CpaE [Sphingomonas panacisoli]QDZ08647.1 pilus assembly protein CpaE [Sphingomonas panacisoli]